MKINKFEDALIRLQEIAETLEGGDTPLDEMMHLFGEAQEMAAFCHKKLDAAEAKLQHLGKAEDASIAE